MSRCTREEIERKRLAALEKRKSKILTPTSAECNILSTATVNSSSYISGTASHVPSLTTMQAKQSTVNENRCLTPNKTVANKQAGFYHPYKTDPSRLPVQKSPSVSRVVSGVMYLVSEERFEVKPSEFCPPLIDVFKTIQSRNYDSRSRLWNFSLEDYEILLNKVAPLAPDVVLGGLPTYVLKILREPVVDADSIDLTAVEPTLRNKLMPFQQDGVRFGIAKGGRCMIADDMGLGKTFQALAIANYYRNDWPLLIVTTSSMRETWRDKMTELLPCVPLPNVVTLSAARDCERAADVHAQVVIVSYKICSLQAQMLKRKKFGVVIIDECHYLKSHKAQCTVALSGITKSARRVVLLSGTPALSRCAELYTQLSIIEPKLFGSFTEYGKRYCGGKMTNFGWDMSGQSNLAELQVLLHKKFLIRRTKEQVLTNIQEKVREAVILEPTALRVSHDAREQLTALAQSVTRLKSAEKHAALLTFFSESAKVKLCAVCKYISEVARSHSGKFLVFAHHKTVLDMVCLTLDELGVGYICIAGQTRTDMRSTLVDRFQSSDSCRAAVLSITAASTGLTLTAAQLVIFAELHWNPGVLTQAESRAHRIGQRGGVRVVYLLAHGTSDDFMWPMLQHKLNVLNEVGLSKDNFDDTECTRQESSNTIMNYFTSPNGSMNKNDYVPGTNIKKSLENSSRENSISKENLSISHRQENTDGIDKSFFEDDEEDDLLAALDI